jgi:hypothetical protein
MNSKNTSMNQEEIKQLLDKYYDGETTRDEEIVLKEYFSHNAVPSELTDEAEIFRYYSGSFVIPEPSDDFENRIISAIDSADQIADNIKRRKIYITLSGVAAVMLILAGTYFFFIQKSEPRDTYSDPEIAYAETMKILYNVSGRINHGTKALGQLGELRDETSRSINTLNKSTSVLKEKMKPLNNMLKTMENINKYQNNN